MFHRGKVTNRSKTFVIAVDADLTMFNTLSPWLNHFGIGDIPLPIPKEDECIDLVHHIEEHSGVIPAESVKWWHNPAVYTNLELLNGFKEFLDRLEDLISGMTGLEVSFIVVSSCFPSHEEAKWKEIERLMPNFFDAKISTSSKHYVDFDLIIDDSMGVAKNCVAAGKVVFLVDTGLGLPSFNLLSTNKLKVIGKGLYPHGTYIDQRLQTQEVQTFWGDLCKNCL